MAFNTNDDVLEFLNNVDKKRLEQENIDKFKHSVGSMNVPNSTRELANFCNYEDEMKYSKSATNFRDSSSQVLAYYEECAERMKYSKSVNTRDSSSQILAYYEVCNNDVLVWKPKKAFGENNAFELCKTFPKDDFNNQTATHDTQNIQMNQPESMECNFCKKNKEPSSVFKSHALKDSKGRVLCPILSKYKCDLCGATGDIAHTRLYCPINMKERSLTKTPTAHMANGKLRKFF